MADKSTTKQPAGKQLPSSPMTKSVAAPPAAGVKLPVVNPKELTSVLRPVSPIPVHAPNRPLVGSIPAMPKLAPTNSSASNPIVERHSTGGTSDVLAMKSATPPPGAVAPAHARPEKKEDPTPVRDRLGPSALPNTTSPRSAGAAPGRRESPLRQVTTASTAASMSTSSPATSHQPAPSVSTASPVPPIGPLGLNVQSAPNSPAAPLRPHAGTITASASTGNPSGGLTGSGAPRQPRRLTGAPPIEVLNIPHAKMTDTMHSGLATPRGITPLTTASLQALELPSSTPKYFPWILYMPDQGDGLPNTGNSADFVVRHVLAEFLHLATRKIGDIMSLNIDEKFLLSDVFDFTNDPNFASQIDALQRISKKHMQRCVKALRDWMLSQHSEVEKLKQRLVSTQVDGSRFSVKEGLSLLEERHQLCVQYIFLKSLHRLFENLTKEALDDALLEPLLELVFDNLKAQAERRLTPTDSKAALTNRNAVPELWAIVLGQLSTVRPQQVATRFFKEMVFTNTNTRARAAAVLAGIRFLKFKLHSKKGTDFCVEFLERYHEVLKAAKKQEILTTLIETLVGILTQLVYAPRKDSVSYVKFHQTIVNLYTAYKDKKKRTKNVVLYHPFLTILLCLTDTDFFMTNWWPFLDSSIINKTLMREKAMRGVNLECIGPLVENYLLRSTESTEVQLLKLTAIRDAVFPTNVKRLTLSGSTESLETYVAILVIIARKRLDYAVDKIILELIRTSTAAEFQAEKVLVGLKAISHIYGAARQTQQQQSVSTDSSVSSSPERKPSKLNTSPNPANRKGQPQSPPLSGRAANGASSDYQRLVSYFPKISQSLVAILTTLDQHFGWLQSNQQKSLQELSTKSTLPANLCLDIFKWAIPLVPFVLTSVPNDVIGIMTRFLVHLDKSVQERATQTLSVMMQQRPDLRPTITTATADFLLQISDTRHEIVHAVLDKLSRLLKEWVALTAPLSATIVEAPIPAVSPTPRGAAMLTRSPAASGSSPPPNPLGQLHLRNVSIPLRSSGSLAYLTPQASPRSDSAPTSARVPTSLTGPAPLPSLGFMPKPLTPAQLTRLEAIALVFLCSPYGKMRQLALDILENARGIHRRFEEDEIMLEQRVHDIISEAGPDLIQQLHQDFMFRLKNPIINTIEKSLDKVAASDAAGAQLCWSYCLGSLVKQVLTLCADPVRLAFGMACARMSHVQPSVDDAKLIETDLKLKTNLLWWKNYVIFACAAAQPDFPSHERVMSGSLLTNPTGNSGSGFLHFIGATPSSTSLAGSSTSSATTAARSDPALADERPRESIETNRSSITDTTAARYSSRALLEQIAQNLKNDTVREAAVMALERTNSAVLDHLVEAVRRVEKEFLTKKGPKKDRLRQDVGAVFSYIAENMPQGTLKHNEKLRKAMLEYILEAVQYFQRPENESLSDHQFTRYYLCAITKAALQDIGGAADMIEKASRKGLFQFLVKWTHGEKMLQDEANRKASHLALAQMRDAKQRETYEAQMREGAVVLQFSACSAIGAVLLGPCWDEDAKLQDGPVFAWISHLLRRDQAAPQFFSLRTLACTAAESFLSKNPDKERMLATLVDLCYSQDEGVARGYFLALVELFKNADFNFPLPVLLVLIMQKCGDDEPTVRRNAVQLLQLLALSSADGEIWTSSNTSLSVDSPIAHTYQAAQLSLADLLADDHSALSYDVFNHMVRRCDELGILERARMMSCMIPWIKKMDFTQVEAPQETALYNLLSLTVKYSARFPAEVRAIWTTMAADESNVSPVIEFMLKVGDRKRNYNYIPLSKQVVVALGQASPRATVEALVNEVSSLKKKPTRVLVLNNAGVDGGHSSEGRTGLLAQAATNKDENAVWAHATFHALLPDQQHAFPPARGHASLILLAELAFDQAKYFRHFLPVILQQVFLGLDLALQPIVVEHCRILLINLIHGLSTEKGPDDSSAGAPLESFLRSKESKPLWANEDVSIRKPQIASAQELASLVERVMEVLGPSNPQLTDEWASEALSWAISCPSAHLQSRSLQIYRALKPSISREALDEIMQALTKCVSACTSDTLSVTLEILQTLRSLVETMEANKLILFTNLFWGCVAVLHLDYEEVFNHSLAVLNPLIERLNWNDRAVQNIFVASAPKEWNPPFVGLQLMVLKGLMSSITEPMTVELLSRFTQLTCHIVFQPDSTRLVVNTLGLLPTLLSDRLPLARRQTIADNLSAIFERESLQSLSKLFSNYASYTTKLDSFVQDFGKTFCDTFMPTHCLFSFKLLFRLLQRGLPAYQWALLRIIGALCRFMEPVSCFEVFRARIGSWFGLVCHFINTPHWREALEIVDLLVTRLPLTAPQLLERASLESYAPPPLSLRSEWTNGSASETARQAHNALAKILISTDQTKSQHAVSPRFFEKFFSAFSDANSLTAGNDSSDGRSPEMSLRGGALEDGADADTPSAKGPPPLLRRMSSVANAAERAAVPAGAAVPSGAVPMQAADFGAFPQFQGFDDLLSALDSFQGEEKTHVSPAETMVPRAQRSDSGTAISSLILQKRTRRVAAQQGSKLPISTSAVKLSQSWQDALQQNASSSNPTPEMFALFPLATQLLHALKEDLLASLKTYATKVQSENEKIVSSPVLKSASLESIFKLPHPETTKVILNIISTKYRQRLQADAGFEHSFSEQRMHLAQAFHQSHIAYIDQKAAVDALAAAIEGDDNSQFCTGLVALHNQLLQLYLANISLQSLISDLLLTDNESEEELENNKRLVEDELKANAQLAEKIKPTQKKLKRKSSVVAPQLVVHDEESQESTGSFREIKQESTPQQGSEITSSKDSERDKDDRKRDKKERKEREREEKHLRKEEERREKEREKREKKEREKEREKDKEAQKDAKQDKDKSKERVEKDKEKRPREKDELKSSRDKEKDELKASGRKDKEKKDKEKDLKVSH